MKKYALYPGVGRILPERKLEYISGRQLAACYRIPYSECLDTSNSAVMKVINFGSRATAPPIHLVRLLPQESGHYRVPSSAENKIIVVQGLHEAVNKNG